LLFIGGEKEKKLYNSELAENMQRRGKAGKRSLCPGSSRGGREGGSKTVR